jgi:hypothetical protein
MGDKGFSKRSLISFLTLHLQPFGSPLLVHNTHHFSPTISYHIAINLATPPLKESPQKDSPQEAERIWSWSEVLLRFFLPS